MKDNLQISHFKKKWMGFTNQEEYPNYSMIFNQGMNQTMATTNLTRHSSSSFEASSCETHIDSDRASVH